MYELGNTTPERLINLGGHSGKDITIQNQGPDDVLIGGDDSLSIGNYGFKLKVDQAISFELPGSDALYALAAGAAGSVISVLDMTLESGE
jgi:hypothetical protein